MAKGIAPVDGRSPERAARLRVRRPSGSVETLHAERCTIEGGAVHATGRWHHPRGLSARGTYTWPVRRVIEIQWTAAREQHEAAPS